MEKRTKYIIRVYGRRVWVMDIKAAKYGNNKYSVHYTTCQQNAQTFQGRSDAASTAKLLNEDLPPLQFELDQIKIYV